MSVGAAYPWRWRHYVPPKRREPLADTASYPEDVQLKKSILIRHVPRAEQSACLIVPGLRSVSNAVDRNWVFACALDKHLSIGSLALLQHIQLYEIAERWNTRPRTALKDAQPFARFRSSCSCNKDYFHCCGKHITSHGDQSVCSNHLRCCATFRPTASTYVTRYLDRIIQDRSRGFWRTRSPACQIFCCCSILEDKWQ